MSADPVTLVIVAATFLLAGTVKGVIGLGLPTISLALLAIAFDLASAMALLLVPSFVTNLWQALGGGGLAALSKRLWPFLLCAGGAVWIGASALARANPLWLTALLGLLLAVYAGLGLSGWRATLAPQREVWAGPLAGLVNGLLTGMTGSFVVPGVMYLQALGLDRERLVQAMGMLFTVSTLALAGALGSNRLVSAELLLWSAAALAPALFGMLLGRRVGQALPERTFRRVFFCALLLLGGYILLAALYRAIGA